MASFCSIVADLVCIFPKKWYHWRCYPLNFKSFSKYPFYKALLPHSFCKTKEICEDFPSRAIWYACVFHIFHIIGETACLISFISNHLIMTKPCYILNTLETCLHPPPTDPPPTHLPRTVTTPPTPPDPFFIKKETLTRVFSCEFCEIFKNTTGRLLLIFVFF